MRRLILLLALPLALAFGNEAAGAAVQAYFYPFVSPFEATVMDLPAGYLAKLPEEVPSKVFQLKVFPQRRLPAVFWYEEGFHYSLAAQPQKAPLIFVIAGTGSRYNSSTMLKLQGVFYQAGFHVVSITSPTHMNFVINASKRSMPGDIREDSRDLYRVMQQVWEQLRGEVEVSGFALAGYSLGGLQAAFVSMLDEDRKHFDFRKVLLLNPPVSLYNTATALDGLLVENIPGGEENFNRWFQRLLLNVAAVSQELGYMELTGDFLFKAYKRHPPTEANLKAVIGLAFRMDAANMIFTADVMNGGGYIVPTHTRLSNSTSLTPYAMVAYRTSFLDYFHEYFFPYHQRREPGLTEQTLIERLSLQSIEPYLRSAEKIGLVGNEDDVILLPGEIEYLQQVFGDRAMIFPTGGHLGNVNHPDVVRFMSDFLRGETL
jgi:hypothetical protein